MNSPATPITKDCEKQGPVPSAWRPVLHKIVDAFVEKNYKLKNIEGVSHVSDKTVEQIKEYIEDYGEELIPLPADSWKTSTCMYMGSYWDVIIDLWTASEGHSDLVLHAKIYQDLETYRIDIHMVYVP